MEIALFIRNKQNEIIARGLYQDGAVTVKAGGHISEVFAFHGHGGAMALKFRNNPEYVNQCLIIKDCRFDSPSTAAQFVNGRSTNGYIAWRTDEGLNLGQYLDAHGLRLKK